MWNRTPTMPLGSTRFRVYVEIDLFAGARVRVWGNRIRRYRLGAIENATNELELGIESGLLNYPD